MRPIFHSLTFIALLFFSIFQAPSHADEKEGQGNGQKLKIGGINLSRSFQSYFQRTKDAGEIEPDLAPIRKVNRERLKGIRKLAGQLAELRKTRQAAAPKLDEVLKEKIKELEEAIEALQRERREFLARRLKALDPAILKILSRHRKDHLKQLNAYAKKEKFDYIFDTSAHADGHPASLPIFSGEGNSTMPFDFLGDRLIDITAEVIALGEVKADDGGKR